VTTEEHNYEEDKIDVQADSFNVGGGKSAGSATVRGRAIN
jgi:hypothetical protein